MNFKSLTKKTLFIIIPIFVLLVPIVSDAFQCSPPPPNSLFVTCENNLCKDGFEVQYHDTDNFACDDQRPVVVDTNNVATNFVLIAQELNIGLLSGTYELKPAWCIDSWKEEFCLNGRIVIEKISDDTTFTELNILKEKWQKEEQRALRAATTKKWLVEAIIIAITALVIFWPWILIKLWPKLRKSLSLFLIGAIFLQVPTAFILSAWFMWDSRLWILTTFVFFHLFGLVILGEIVFLIVRAIRKIKSKKQQRKT